VNGDVELRVLEVLRFSGKCIIYTISVDPRRAGEPAQYGGGPGAIALSRICAGGHGDRATTVVAVDLRPAVRYNAGTIARRSIFIWCSTVVRICAADMIKSLMEN